jgi:hypothetical protein
MDDATIRADRVRGYRDELVRTLVRAYDLRKTEPDLSLHLLRQAAEGLCYCVLLTKNRLGIDQKAELGKLLADATSLVRQDEATLQALREWGNRASHAQGRPEQITSDEAIALFLLSARPIEWLFRDVLREPLPAKLAERFQALRGAQRPHSTRSPVALQAHLSPTPRPRVGKSAIAIGVGALVLVAAVTTGVVVAPNLRDRRALTRVRALENALAERADAAAAAALYADPAGIYGKQKTRAQTEAWIKAFWKENPDPNFKVHFTACRFVSATDGFETAVCDVVWVERSAEPPARECFTWSDDGLIQVRENAPSPRANNGGCRGR